MKDKHKKCSIVDMITYSTGEAANSLILNSIFAFAMLYYTEALGLKYSLAGLALSVAIFWDAITDPIMGHISDHTRSRFGRRHPYILIGGIMMVLTYFFLWKVPPIFTANNLVLFWYLVVMNLILRTAYTAFIIPYTALGFEMCTEYEGRSTLQGIRMGTNMLANLLGPAMAWAIFFNNNEVERATKVPENYISMGFSFMVVSIFLILLVTFWTAKYIKDTRNAKTEGKGVKGFFKDLWEIIQDSNPRWVFAFIFIVLLGISLVSNLQMYLYEHFLRFGGTQKSIAHGGTMVGMGLGALFSPYLVKYFEKKGAVYLGGLWSVFCCLILAVLLLPGWLVPGQKLMIADIQIPITFIVFVFFHCSYWFGNGIMMPISVSMMADVSELYQLKTGINKDGAYSAAYSFATKLAMSTGPLLTGLSLTMAGFAAEKEFQTDQAIWRLCAVTLIAGPIISLTALFLIKKYPVTKEFLEKKRSESDEGEHP